MVMFIFVSRNQGKASKVIQRENAGQAVFETNIPNWKDRT